MHRGDPRRGHLPRRRGGDDPTEKANGRGLGILRDEGIEIVVAGEAQAARARLENQAFRKRARTGRPWVLFKAAMSLDGKVATRAGDSQWISCQSSRELAHQWRAEVDAVVVGIGTALTDDPRLTARVPGVERQPRRIVFDSTARLPLDSKLVRDASEIPLTIVVSRAAGRSRGRDARDGGRPRDHRDGRERARPGRRRARPARRFVGVLIFAITGMIMTDIIDRYETRFDKWRPKVGAE